MCCETPHVIPISDPTDPRVDDYRSLRGRERTDVLYAEGPTVIERLCATPLTIRSALLTAAAYERLAPSIGGRAPIYVADRAVVAAIVDFDLHRGAIAIADRPAPAVLQEVLRRARRLVVLEGINDSENLGAIGRSARALGADALVLDPTCADPYYRRSVRVSMGELLHLPVVRSADWGRTLDEIAAAGFDVWALTPDPAAADVYTLPAPERLAIVAGAEGPGLSAATLARWTNVRIPLRGDVDSLNVGHAVAVTLALTLARP